MRYTSDQLISQMLLNASMPTSQKKFTNARCLQFLNEELMMTIQPKLLELRADFFVTHVDIPLVANTSEYDLPSKTIGWSLYDWGYLDANNEYRSLGQTSIPYLERYSNVTTDDHPSFLYFENAKIKTRPLMNASPIGSLRLFYERMQNELVLTTDCGLISNVGTSGGNYDLTVNALPVYSAGVDIISGTTPYGLIAEAQTASVVGLVMSIPITAFDRAPIVGDYIAPVGKTPIPSLPDMVFPALAMAGTLRILEASGDTKNLQVSVASLGTMLQKIENRCEDRVKARPKKILTKNYLLNYMRR